MRYLYSHHISTLIVYIILNTLRSHPPDGNPLLTSHRTPVPAEIVSPIHVFCGGGGGLGPLPKPPNVAGIVQSVRDYH